MRKFLYWWSRHQQGIILALAVMLAVAVTVAQRSYVERKASEAIHKKLDYESQLFKFLLIDGGCKCANKQ